MDLDKSLALVGLVLLGIPLCSWTISAIAEDWRQQQRLEAQGRCTNCGKQVMPPEIECLDCYSEKQW